MRRGSVSFSPRFAADIEGVHRPLAIAVHVGGQHLQPGAGEDAGELLQKAWPIAAGDLHHTVAASEASLSTATAAGTAKAAARAKSDGRRGSKARASPLGGGLQRARKLAQGDVGAMAERSARGVLQLEHVQRLPGPWTCRPRAPTTTLAPTMVRQAARSANRPRRSLAATTAPGDIADGVDADGGGGATLRQRTAGQGEVGRLLLGR